MAVISWRDRLTIPATIKGSGGIGIFWVDSSSASFGRRQQVHQYAGRDNHYVEDLGRDVREFSLDGFVVGDDYIGQRDKIRLVLENSIGPLSLTHPYWGELTVYHQGKFTFTESAQSEGGVCRFTLNFINSGLPTDKLLPSPSGGGMAKQAAAVAAAKVQSKYSSTKAAISKVINGFGAVNIALRLVNGAIQSRLNYIGKFEAQMEQFNDNIESIASTPSVLSSSMANVAGLMMESFSLARPSNTFGQVTQFIDIAKVMIEALDGLSDAAMPIPDEGEGTETQLGVIQSIRNFNWMTRMSFATAAANAIVDVVDQIQSQSDALKLLKSYREFLDLVIEDEYLDDDLYVSAKTLQATVSRFLRDEAEGLPKSATIKLPALTPSLVVAQDYYQDASKELEFVRRNNIPHPLLCPAAVELEILR